MHQYLSNKMHWCDTTHTQYRVWINSWRNKYFPPQLPLMCFPTTYPVPGLGGTLQNACYLQLELFSSWCVRLDLFLSVVCPKLWIETNIFVTKSLCSDCCVRNSEETPDSAVPMLPLHTAAKESQSQPFSNDTGATSPPWPFKLLSPPIFTSLGIHLLPDFSWQSFFSFFFSFFSLSSF